MSKKTSDPAVDIALNMGDTKGLSNISPYNISPYNISPYNISPYNNSPK